MFVTLSFIGHLQEYALHSVKQIRHFYDGPLFFIRSDPKYDQEFTDLGVNPVRYRDVADYDFVNFAKEHWLQFPTIPKLGHRQLLFMRAFERFFLLKNLMKKTGMTDCLFMEVDNLIYDDPRKWEKAFSEKPIAWCKDDKGRISTGISYFKNWEILEKLTQFHYEYIADVDNKGGAQEDKYVHEMAANSVFADNNPDDHQILPSFWDTSMYLPEMSEGLDKYDSTIFDSAAIGIFVLGPDIIFSDGKVDPGLKSPWSMIDYTKFKYYWYRDNRGKKCISVEDTKTQKAYKINNLHAHSKDLLSGMSD